MKVRWLVGALQSLRDADSNIRADNPEAAAKLAERVENAVSRLASHPSLGRPGRRHGTRELVLPGLPSIIIYTVGDAEVRILRVFYTSQRWPVDGNRALSMAC